MRDLLACLDTFFAHVRGLGDGFGTLTGLAAEIKTGPVLETRAL